MADNVEEEFSFPGFDNEEEKTSEKNEQQFSEDTGVAFLTPYWYLSVDKEKPCISLLDDVSYYQSVFHYVNGLLL
jgi:hypothetical protein